ncbi:MAG: methyltransferase domain-containing protein [Candidatus Promineifilaceae bacterium]|nr:methyltransferase domain-containing protein [Candidatus Promineifilaceae bacterium]
MSQEKEMIVYGQTMPGIEEIAWMEIRDRFSSANFRETLFAKNQNGIVLFDYNGPLEKLFELRTTEDLFLQAVSIKRVSRGRQDLKQFTFQVEKSESFGRAAKILMRFRKFSQPPTFRVISRKYGQHQYRRIDMETAVWQGVQNRYPRWRPVDDNAQIEIWTNLLGSHLLIGFRLTDRSMRHRYKNHVQLPGALRPSIAAAMIFLTRPQAADTFMDPMCGSGTILLERLYSGPSTLILGGDIEPDRVKAARQNLPRARKGSKKRRITIRYWDARQLPLDDHSVDKVATNLPFGKKLGSGQDLRELYSAVLSELQRVVKPDGQIVLLSSEYELVKSCIRQQSNLQIVTGYSIATLGQWARIHIVKRLP